MEHKFKKILVVEDHSLAQKMVVMTLKAVGSNDVDVANNGTEAFNQFQEKHYDLIFMDLGLPDIDGYTVTKKIRDLEKQKLRAPVTIVALTAHIEEKCKNNALNSGMDNFLSKPISLEQARDIIVNGSFE